MELRKFIYALPIAAAAFVFAACNDVAEDDRFIYVKPADVKKCVLIEDFTAQRCVNCPRAAEAIEQLQESYGADNVIAVGLYSGNLGKLPNGTPLPLYNETANWYYEQHGSPSQPAVMIDRQGVQNDMSTLGTYVNNRIQQEPVLQLGAVCEYDEASRSVGITVTAEGLADVEGRLQVWLVEDGITSLQFMTDGSVNQNYVHNHVFRATVNDRQGDQISLTMGQPETKTFTYVLDADWVAENMSVVAFVYNDTGVLQAAKAKVIAPAEDDTPLDGGEAAE